MGGMSGDNSRPLVTERLKTMTVTASGKAVLASLLEVVLTLNAIDIKVEIQDDQDVEIWCMLSIVVWGLPPVNTGWAISSVGSRELR